MQHSVTFVQARCVFQRQPLRQQRVFVSESHRNPTSEHSLSEDNVYTHIMRLPGGEYWWLGRPFEKELIFGEGFVVTRQRKPRATSKLTKEYQSNALAVFVPGIMGLSVPKREFEQTTQVVPVFRLGNTQSAASDTKGHPRRTARVSFTCKLCKTRNIARPVNPLAWDSGSVFIQCDRCEVVHKLKDNLKIFHELRDVFPPRELRNSLLIQQILDNIKQDE